MNDYLDRTRGRSLDSLSRYEELQALREEALRLAGSIDEFCKKSNDGAPQSALQQAIVSGCQNIGIRSSHVLGVGAGSFSTENEVVLCQALLGKEIELVVDVGANKGEYTKRVLALNANAEVHLFEPAASNAAYLERTFGECRNVRICKLALSDNAGIQTLYYDEPGSGLASVYKRDLSHTNLNLSMSEEVRAVQLDEYWSRALSQRTIDILKLDIEGAELRALQGARACLAKTRVVQFEFGGANIDSRTHFRDFWQLLHQAGFELYRHNMFGGMKVAFYNEREERFETSNIMARNRRLVGN